VSLRNRLERLETETGPDPSGCPVCNNLSRMPTCTISCAEYLADKLPAASVCPACGREQAIAFHVIVETREQARAVMEKARRDEHS
jgi:hypothetical protein